MACSGFESKVKPSARLPSQPTVRCFTVEPRWTRCGWLWCQTKERLSEKRCPLPFPDDRATRTGWDGTDRQAKNRQRPRESRSAALVS